MTTAYIHNTKRRQREFFERINTKKNKLILLVVAVVLLVLYAYQTSALATRTFAINELEKELHTLEQEQKELQVKIAEYRSLKNIESRLDGKTYVHAQQISYISPIGSAVAQR